MTENPWKKKHPGRRIVTIRTPDRVRKDLFAAGWKPIMAGSPVTDERIGGLLLELNAAERQKTMRIIRQHARSR